MVKILFIVICHADETVSPSKAHHHVDDFYNYWSLQGTVPPILALCAFPLLNFESPTFFTKFNVLGNRLMLLLNCLM